MARKVFISFLGTGNYLQTRYEMGDYISSPTRFIQLALIDYICLDWCENDRIFIFYTEKSLTRLENRRWFTPINPIRENLYPDRKKKGYIKLNPKQNAPEFAKPKFQKCLKRLLIIMF
jgi:hypothetical protein